MLGSSSLVISLSLFLASFHFLIAFCLSTAAFIVVGICVGWIDPTPADIGLMAGIFLVGHCIIWLIMYARYKKETRELNTLVKEAHRKEAWSA